MAYKTPTRDAKANPRTSVARGRSSLASSAAPTTSSSATASSSTRSTAARNGQSSATASSRPNMLRPKAAAAAAAAHATSTDSPSLVARLPSSTQDEEDEDSGLLDFSAKLDDLSFGDSPLTSSTKEKGSSGGTISGGSTSGRNGVLKSKKASRPSWGPPLPPTGASQDASGKGKMRLLQGLEDDSSAPGANSISATDDDAGSSMRMPASKKEKSLGGLLAGGKMGAKPRFSLFAKPSYLETNTNGGSGNHHEEDDGGEEDGDESIRLGKGKDEDLFKTQSQQQLQTSSAGVSRSAEDATEPTPAGRSESKEQVQNQLRELKMMNEVFEAYETALRGGANQIDDFAEKITNTNALLDVYIDLLRHTNRTQALLLDGDWKGASEDASAHALAMELAEREKRRREEEAQEAARQAALRAQLEEEARRAEEAAEKRKKTALGTGRLTRGGGTTTATRGRTTTLGGASSSTRGGATQGTMRGASSSFGATRGRPTTTTTSAPTGTGRTSAGTTGTGSGRGRYANVKSSGYGPAR